MEMLTVVETAGFRAQASQIWNEAEREAFIDWIASNPEAGDVIPRADGARKVRWAMQGRGKRCGARVIYFNLLDDGLIVLIAVYAKNIQENAAPKTVRKRKNEAQRP